jgi:hypothetical protein
VSFLNEILAHNNFHILWMRAQAFAVTIPGSAFIWLASPSLSRLPTTALHSNSQLAGWLAGNTKNGLQNYQAVPLVARRKEVGWEHRVPLGERLEVITRLASLFRFSVYIRHVLMASRFCVTLE